MGGGRKNQRGSPQILSSESRTVQGVISGTLGNAKYLPRDSPDRLGWAGTALKRQEQPMGCGKAVSLSARQGVLRRWTEGKVWQGESLFGQ